MAGRALSWTLALGLAVGGFLITSRAGTSPAGPASDASRAPAAPAVPAMVGPGAAPPADVSVAQATILPAATRPTGAELYAAVNDAFPEQGRVTWAAIDVAVSRLVESYVAVHGAPAARCATDGSLDDVILTVQWKVSTDDNGVHVRGGRVAIDEFAPAVHACLDGYLSAIAGDFPTPAPPIALDIRYQLPMRAAAPSPAGAPSADAGLVPLLVPTDVPSRQ